jgi:C1A family cysteine protease
MTRRIQRYGWKPDLPDHRDLWQVEKPVAVPNTFDQRTSPFMPAIWNQGELGSCSAHALARAFEFDQRKQGLPDFMPSRLMIYYDERAMEGTTDQDSGAMLRDGAKTLALQGVGSEVEWPYDITKFTQKPPVEAYLQGVKHKVVAYSRVPQTMHSIQQQIAAGFLVVFGFSVFESFESPEVAQSGIVPYPGPNEQCCGGHAVCGVGYTQENVIVANSWDVDWGLKGYFLFPWRYMLNPGLVQDLWTFRQVEA